jgi:predicted 3-demethylubiquinone-9 3-methyltransferase (glyoxalase superfamily)
MKQKITTFLTFNDCAEDAARYYCETFENSKILSTSPGPGGKPMTVEFELEGQRYIALNGGPSFKFSSGFSLFVSVETQAEVDRLWARLSDGGAEDRCGWLVDRFGVSWQIIPTALMKGLSGPNAGAVAQAMFKMKKLDVAELERAARGG